MDGYVCVCTPSTSPPFHPNNNHYADISESHVHIIKLLLVCLCPGHATNSVVLFFSLLLFLSFFVILALQKWQVTGLSVTTNEVIVFCWLKIKYSPATS